MHTTVVHNGCDTWQNPLPATDENCTDFLLFPAIYVNNGVGRALDRLDVVSSAQTSGSRYYGNELHAGKRGRSVYNARIDSETFPATRVFYVNNGVECALDSLDYFKIGLS